MPWNVQAGEMKMKAQFSSEGRPGKRLNERRYEGIVFILRLFPSRYK